MVEPLSLNNFRVCTPKLMGARKLRNFMVINSFPELQEIKS